MPSESMRLSKAAHRYLERHAEPEATAAKALADTGARYPAVVVIPAYGEHDLLLHTLDSVPQCCNDRPLVVLVVNQRDACNAWASDANRKILSRLRGDARAMRPLGANVDLLVFAGFDMALIDRTLPGQCLPKRQGVGLARKIGADFAMALWATGGCTSPWIHCTDADVRLPADYFDRSRRIVTGSRTGFKPAVASALLFDFRHATCDPAKASEAILEYEIYLRYVVLGLRSVCSPYAFHSIGSTFAVHANAYAQVRGFPKRFAAEDFHLLAKLAKVGPIRSLPGDPIVISGRTSDRVPFGTGHAMHLAEARSQSLQPFPAYDPRSFRWLGVWLATLDSMAEQPTTPVGHLIEFHAEQTEVDPKRLEGLLDSFGALESAKKALQNKGNRRRSLNENFDALATLKLLHALRDQVYPLIPLELALKRASFIDHDPEASLEDQRTDLAKLEVSAGT